MRVTHLNQHNRVEIIAVMRHCQQLLPFFVSNSQAQAELLACLTEPACKVKGLEENHRLIGLISYRQERTRLVITSILVSQKRGSKTRGLSEWLNQVERIVKLQRATAFSFEVKMINQGLVKRMQQAGYDLQEVRHNTGVFSQEVNYRTGLVLAGGGARGAYQIGAWRALKELGVDVEIITGTSVGALNGALMLQNDFQAAEAMWSQIETGKILSFPMVQGADSFTLGQMMKELQQFAFSAISNQGVSTEPLQQLINDVLDEELIRQDERELCICATQLPSLKEVVVSLKETPVGEFHQWLLASSSFFPAMAAAKIADTYYVDGGYRNNIPIDVALNRGATEIIVIDVKGPGLTKPLRLADELPLVTVSSPWSLGALLLFDSNRSKWNQQLGYLETLKAFGNALGYWYTFDHNMTDSSIGAWHRQLNQALSQQFNPREKQLFAHPEIIKDLLKKMRRLYSDRATAATISLFVLEFMGKVLNLPPTELYTVSSFVEGLKGALKTGHLGLDQEPEKMLLSLPEWLQLYADDALLPTEKGQVMFIYQKVVEKPNDPLLLGVARAAPHLYLVAHGLKWLVTQQN